MTIRVVLPPHLRTLARVDGELDLQVKTPVSQRAVLVACGEDLSHESPDTPLPDPIASGSEPFLIIGAIAGG